MIIMVHHTKYFSMIGIAMKELRNDKLLQKTKQLYDNILKLKQLDIDNYYCAKLLDWFNEVVYKILPFTRAKSLTKWIKNYIKKNVNMYIELILVVISGVNLEIHILLL